jgi:hypothetical protein
LPSTITGTVAEPVNSMRSFSVKRHGTDSNSSPLCLSAIFVRQQ